VKLEYRLDDWNYNSYHNCTNPLLQEMDLVNLIFICLVYP
jgi:hypothetical protein